MTPIDTDRLRELLTAALGCERWAELSYAAVNALPALLDRLDELSRENEAMLDLGLHEREAELAALRRVRDAAEGLIEATDHAFLNSTGRDDAPDLPPESTEGNDAAWDELRVALAALPRPRSRSLPGER